MDSSNYSMVLCFRRSKSETGFRGVKLFPTVQCTVQGRESGIGRCSVKALGWVCEGGGCGGAEEGGDGPVHCLAISPFFRMICRCQGASLVSS